MLGVTVFAILPESLAALRWWWVVLAVASGYAVFALISKYVDRVRPACAASHFDEATTHHFSEIAAAMMLALAIHCTANGLALAAGHEAEASHAPGGRVLEFSLIWPSASTRFRKAWPLAACCLARASTERKPCRASRRSNPPRCWAGSSAWFSCPIFPRSGSDAAVAHVGGGFLFLAIHAVLGEFVKHHKALALTNFAFGFGAIAALTLLLRLL